MLRQISKHQAREANVAGASPPHAARSVQSWHNIDRVLRLHVTPSFGDRPMAEIRRAEIYRLLDDIIATGRIGTAREVKKQRSRFYNWAVDREIVESNPVFAMKRPELYGEGPRCAIKRHSDVLN